MIKRLNGIDASKTYGPNGYAVKATDDGYLLTPNAEQAALSRLRLIVDQVAYLDENGQPLNGAFPAPVSSAQAKLLIGDIKFALRGNPEAILFTKVDSTTGKKKTCKVVRPSQADQFLLRTNWSLSSDVHTGANRKYAAQHGSVAFSSRKTTDQNGQDFWQLSISMLSPETVQAFDQAWATRIRAAIDDHATRFPQDAELVKAHHRLLDHPEDEGATNCAPPPGRN